MNYFNDFQNNGFAIIEEVYNCQEIETLIAGIDSAEHSNASFRITNDLFAIRRFLKEVPLVVPLIFNQKLKNIISDLDPGCFAVKSIYFDKPEKSNWFVAWHQDLTISVNNRVDLPGFNFWTKKFEQYSVQPPIEFLETGFTIRIHLDDTDENNGALKVIPGSHLKNIMRANDPNLNLKKEELCPVRAGGVMVMRPLLMHASDRTRSNNQRRVIHIEFNSLGLPAELEWAEKLVY